MFTTFKISSLKSVTALSLAALIGVAASTSAYAAGNGDGRQVPGQYSETSTVEIASTVDVGSSKPSSSSRLDRNHGDQ